MKQRTCIVCSEQLPENAHNRAKLCSAECKEERKRQYVQERLAKQTPEQLALYNAARREKRAQWTAEQKHRQYLCHKNWYQKRTPEQRAKERAYEQKRRTEILNVQVACALRWRLNCALRTNSKKGLAVKDLGCSIAQFKAYIESKFQPGMSWSNWSRYGWHLDHVQPLRSFDLSKNSEFRRAAHYTNYQPLWAKDNLSKGARV